MSRKRSFWMHQVAEYVIAAAFVASGLQSPTPIVPSMLGVLVLLNVATSQGPLSAFRLFPRRVHQVLDLALIALIAIAAVQPWWTIDGGTRAVMGLLAGALLVIWWQSDFSPPQRAAAGGGTSRGPANRSSSDGVAEGAASTAGGRADTIGRAAGRLAGQWTW
ncbi:MAG TPA: hypothetical protein PLV68_07085 [Ilumatobacteraceae bacterium]|nr:hypothetical protein [Ilumatobacteraceae bacterium]